MTIIEGIDEHDIDIRELTKTLKAKCACGGTAKNGQIELQGDHKVKVKEVDELTAPVPDNTASEAPKNESAGE